MRIHSEDTLVVRSSLSCNGLTCRASLIPPTPPLPPAAATARGGRSRGRGARGSNTGGRGGGAPEVEVVMMGGTKYLRTRTTTTCQYSSSWLG
jgi:hypothetical protein